MVIFRTTPSFGVFLMCVYHARTESTSLLSYVPISGNRWGPKMEPFVFSIPRCRSICICTYIHWSVSFWQQVNVIGYVCVCVYVIALSGWHARPKTTNQMIDCTRDQASLRRIYVYLYICGYTTFITRNYTLTTTNKINDDKKFTFNRPNNQLVCIPLRSIAYTRSYSSRGGFVFVIWFIRVKNA